MLNSLILFPLLTNAVVRGFAWISILGRNGLLNQAFSALGLTSEPLHLLYTEGAIVVGSVYLFLPTVLSTLSSVMEKIGGETIEAAYSLGARPITAFFRIIVPLSFSGTLVSVKASYDSCAGIPVRASHPHRHNIVQQRCDNFDTA